MLIVYKLTYLVVLDKKNKVSCCFQAGSPIIFTKVLLKNKQLVACTQTNIMFFAGEALQPMFLVAHPSGSVYSAFESLDRSILLSIDCKVFKVQADCRSIKQIFDSGEPLLPILSIH